MSASETWRGSDAGEKRRAPEDSFSFTINSSNLRQLGFADNLGWPTNAQELYERPED